LVVAGTLAWLAGGSWRVIWLVFAGVALVVTLLAYVTVPNGAAMKGFRRGSEGYRVTAAAIPLCALSALYGAAGAVFFTFAVDLVHSEGLSEGWSSLMWLLVGIGGISGVATGAIVNRLGLRAALQSAVVLLAASIVGIAIAPAVVLPTALAALTFGFAYMPFAALLTIWNQRVHPRHPTSGLVVALCSLGVGSVIGPAALGVIADAHGLRLAFAIAAAITVVAGIPLCRDVENPETAPSQGCATN
jgi:predicted MFS family arabinose efflux permease